MSESPYRTALSLQEFDADTEDGPIRLLVEPNHIRLELTDYETWIFSGEGMTITDHTRRRPKRKSVSLHGKRLYVGCAWPSNEISLWIERKPGVVQRLLGLPPCSSLDHAALDALHGFEKLAKRLRLALTKYSKGAVGSEFGTGKHRIFVTHDSDTMAVYVRPLFRERPRWVIELARDGSIKVPRRGGERVHSMSTGVEVIASGDRISFCHPSGEEVAHLYLPWVGHADRAELTRRFHLHLGGSQAQEAARGSSPVRSPLLQPT